MKASASFIISALRSCIEGTMRSSVSPRWPISFSTSARGMTPIASPPASRTASASAPINPTLPPPYTRPIFCRTNSAPNDLAASRYTGRIPLLEPQKTQRRRIIGKRCRGRPATSIGLHRDRLFAWLADSPHRLDRLFCLNGRGHRRESFQDGTEVFRIRGCLPANGFDDRQQARVELLQLVLLPQPPGGRDLSLSQKLQIAVHHEERSSHPMGDDDSKHDKEQRDHSGRGDHVSGDRRPAGGKVADRIDAADLDRLSLGFIALEIEQAAEGQ